MMSHEHEPAVPTAIQTRNHSVTRLSNVEDLEKSVEEIPRSKKTENSTEEKTI